MKKGVLFSKIVSLCSLWLLLVFSVGCATTKEVKPESSQQSVQPAAAAQDNAPGGKEAELLQPSDETRQQKLDEEVPMPQIRKSLSQKPLPPKVEHAPIDAKRVAHVEGNVILNAESMPLSDFVVYALGDTLKVTFFMDEPVMAMKKPVTLRMTQEMPAERVLEIVIGFLEKNDLDVEEKGGALYIMKPKPPVEQPAPVDYRIGRTTENSPAEVFQIVPFRHLHGVDVMQLLMDLFKNVRMQWYGKENAIMFSGTSSAIKEVIDFIDFIDVPTMRDKRLYLFQLTYWQPDDFIKQITAILEGVGIPVAKSSADPGISFIPIKYLNSILMVSPDDTTLKFALDWKKRLDTAESAGTEEKAFTFSPQFSKASDLVDSIKKLYGVMPETAQTPAKGPQSSAPVTSAAPAASISTASSAPAAVPLPVSASVSHVSVASIPGLKISADDRRNVVVIISTPAVYKSLLAILQELDKPPKQVLIEATIAELNLTDDLQYGLEWYIQNKMQQGTYTLSTLGQLGLSTSSGLVYQFLSDSQRFKAAVNAFAQQNRLNVLSTPRIMVLDNQSASITVGSQIPLLSGSTTSTSASTEVTVATQAVQYVTTGIILTVQPTINTEGLLTLTISLEDSEAQTNTTSSIDSPIITTQNLATSVVASTDQTILLGGMISNSISDSETKVPLIGDIPLIGNLFKTRSKSKTKTELIIMLTPRILTSGEAASKITDEIRRGVKWLK